MIMWKAHLLHMVHDGADNVETEPQYHTLPAVLHVVY